MITERQQELLTAIIRDYIKKAQPVGSLAVTGKFKFPVSAATVRNDMVALEDEGYLEQPHTSAGRIPTEKAWRYFLGQLVEGQALSPSVQSALEQLVRQQRHDEPEELFKKLARYLAEQSQETVVVAFSPHDLYYTGLSQLFQQPEFEEHELVNQFSDIMDHLDSVMEKLYARVTGDVQVLIGSDNPFSPFCGAIVARCRARNREGVVTLIGPTRQAYHTSVPLVRQTQKILQSW